MVSFQTIDQAVKLLVEASHPLKIILFGSYACKSQREDSDVDLLVILPQVQSKYKKMVDLRRVLRPLKLPVDVLVFSKQEVDDWGHLPGTVLYWALKEGRVLHEATD
ncbi:nucleotidyltransferase domain-containing protein [candidate division KSB1 bacterium]|nr:nucleotidyltransferase domain-containing protein [candidate division KSB1 bacterium]